MSKNGFIILIILAVLNIAYVLLRKKFILGNTPQAVIDFPVYESNEEEYGSLKKDVEPFFLDALENRRSELVLTVKQLNCISNRGVTPIKGEILFPTYYEIKDNKLIGNELSYPDIDSMEGYRITIWSTEFAGTMCCSELVSINGCPPSNNNREDRIQPLRDLRLFFFLCCLSNSASKKMSEIAKKITIVEIKDDKLTLKI